MNKLFVYGILKQGFMADLTEMGGTFIKRDEVNGRLFLIAGRGVGLRLDEHPIPSHIRAKGELFEVPESLWPTLDMMEGTAYGMYTRRKIKTLSGVGCFVYEHTGYKNPTSYGSSVPLIVDGVFNGPNSDIRERE